MQHRRFTPVLLALALLALFSTAARAQSRLDGSWTRNRQQSDNVNAAIDAAIKPMNFLVRAVARGRLRTANVAYERLVITSTEDTVNVTYHERAPVITPANGTVVKWWREDGQDFDVSTEWENGRLIQTFRAPDGRRVNVYSVSADGRTLTMDVTLTSPRLSAPLRYKLVFDRAS
ncbi:MAG TPA: hypothetical protein VFS20_09565 [Longimicrobium sp.]|nr:hypothetical protein [Longimicrobium sp.]